MALGIVKHAFNRSSQPIGVIWFTVSLSRSVVVDPIKNNNFYHTNFLNDVKRPRGPGPPIEIQPMIKMSQKRLLFLQFQFLLAFLHTTVQACNSN